MADSVGVKVKMEGEKEFNSALKNMNADLKTLGSEMAAVTSEFIGNEKSAKSLRAQNEVLQKTFETQKQKVELLSAQLQKAKEYYGEDSAEVRKLQQQLNLATAEMNKSDAAIEKNNDAIKDHSAALDKWKGGLKAAAVAVGAVATAAAAAAVAIGKEALNAYAEYEQLVGGVDTLFKEASGTVQAYAENAFKTAGMSANDYMETVTGFSASLISSLGGDTAEAARLADMAITDMSDNANKMGGVGAMESLKNAYSGFAKQQYDMLDNLKLGYGGNQTEMKRLLADASAISGITYDISSYADVVQAIHVIQEEMDIAGTTALEAEATIAGSIGTLGGAWQNLIAGIGNPGADVEKLAETVVNSASTVLTNVMPIIENIVKALPSALTTIISQLVAMLPMLLKTVNDLFSQVLAVVISTLPELIPVALEGVLTIVNTLLDNLPLLMDAAVEIILALALGLSQALPELMPSIVEAVLTIVEGLVGNIDLLLEAAWQLIVGLATGLINAIPVLVQKVPQIVQKLGEAFKSKWEDFKSIGKNIVNGIWEGIKGMAATFAENIKSFFSNIVADVKDVLGIASPSKVFAQVGRYMAEGVGVGFVGTMGGVADDITNSMGNIGGMTVPVSAEATLGSTVLGGLQSAASDIVINITSEIDGTVLARNQYRYNKMEVGRHGGSLVGV